MDIIAYASIAYLAVRLIVIIVNLLTRPYLKKGDSSSDKLISILIPARNEEGNIGKLLDDLAASGYANCEILVYDDDSSDSTAQIIHDKSLVDHRIRYIRGLQLPDGWLGKNHACHQLGLASKGDYLLFLDADTGVSPDLVRDVLSLMEKDKPGLLSIFPVQQMKNPGEWLTVPLMNRILLGNLPLLLIKKSKMPAFSAANGQFMMFNATVYRKHRLHELFREERVEDIRIIRHMKKLGYPVQTVLSGGQVNCRMYSGFGEAMNGFAKNIHAFFGRNWTVLFLYVILTTLGPAAAWLTFGPWFFFAYLFAEFLFTALVAIQSRQQILKNLLLLPFQHLTVLMISILAAYRHFSGRISWKGRDI
jgi:glycosyltransferase involved in cell wall biosynthesis